MTISFEAKYNITNKVLINNSDVLGVVTMIGLQSYPVTTVRYYVEWMDKNNVTNKGWFDEYQLSPNPTPTKPIA